MQDRGSLRRAVKARPGFLFGALVGVYRPRIIFGNLPLVLGQNIDPEALLGVHVSVGAGAVVHADQQQQRIERHGGERIGGHAMDFALQIESDDGHARGEASHRFSKFGWAEGHASLEFPAATAYIITAVAGGSGQWLVVAGGQWSVKRRTQRDSQVLLTTGH